jgi:hypothetical protein
MSESISCARGALLDTWSGHHWKDGIQVESLDDLGKLTVQTENSVYEFTVICPRTGEVLVRGGRFFPEFTPARIAGSSLGGSFLKVRGIYVGFNMEIHTEENRSIITSRVRSIAVPR